MDWQIRWTRRAESDLSGIERRVQSRLISAIERLAASGHGDIKKLSDLNPPEWRLRVGDWRVRFTYLPADRTLLILRVLPRSRAYRD